MLAAPCAPNLVRLLAVLGPEADPAARSAALGALPCLGAAALRYVNEVAAELGGSATGSTLWLGARHARPSHPRETCRPSLPPKERLYGVVSVAGGAIDVVSLVGVGGLQPTVTLKMTGSSASLQSVKIEIMQRIQRHFMINLTVDWED